MENKYILYTTGVNAIQYTVCTRILYGTNVNIDFWSITSIEDFFLNVVTDEILVILTIKKNHSAKNSWTNY